MWRNIPEETNKQTKCIGTSDQIVEKHTEKTTVCKKFQNLPSDLAPELEFDALNHLAMTLYSLNETLAKIFSEKQPKAINVSHYFGWYPFQIKKHKKNLCVIM